MSKKAKWYLPEPTYKPPEPEPKAKRRPRPRVTTVEGPDPIDIFVGDRVRLRRVLLGVSQQKLAAGIGLSFQQIQKYERGTNRISASTLAKFSRILDVPIGFFFDGWSEPGEAGKEGPNFHESRESLELLRNYHAIPEPARGRIYNLIRAMAGSEAEGEDLPERGGGSR